MVAEVMGDELELMDRLKLDLEFGLELELLEVMVVAKLTPN
jgi:hypothetical protein